MPPGAGVGRNHILGVSEEARIADGRGCATDGARDARRDSRVAEGSRDRRR